MCAPLPSLRVRAWHLRLAAPSCPLSLAAARARKASAAFKVFDINDDGVVDQEELIRILTRPQSTSLSREDAKDIITHFNAFDTNGDGVLNIDEFANALATAKNLQQQRQANKPKVDAQAAEFNRKMSESAKLAS